MFKNKYKSFNDIIKPGDGLIQNTIKSMKMVADDRYKSRVLTPKKIIFLTAAVILLGACSSILFTLLRNRTSEPIILTQGKYIPTNIINEEDLIIIGEAKDNVTQENTVVHYIDVYEGGHQLHDSFYALRNVKIRKVIKGEYSDDYIQIREQSTGIVDGKFFTPYYYPKPLKKGEVYIIFIINYNGGYFVGEKANIDNAESVRNLEDGLLYEYKDAIESALHKK